MPPRVEYDVIRHPHNFNFRFGNNWENPSAEFNVVGLRYTHDLFGGTTTNQIGNLIVCLLGVYVDIKWELS